MNTPAAWVRILFHLLLAIFLANAANKFFVPNLEYEDLNGFYAQIFQFRGEAPDQYRILPLLGLKFLCGYLPFNHAVLIFNVIGAFFCFEVLFQLLRKAQPMHRLVFNALLAGVYIYLQYTGWRPDTLGLLAICLLALLPGYFGQRSTLQAALTVLGILAVAFSRSDIALIYAIFLAIYQPLSLPIRIALPILPVLVQIALKYWIFPNATYYTQTFMLWDNLSMYYLVRNPATWLILALGLAFHQPIVAFVKLTFKPFRFLYLLCVAYFLLVLVVGRVNEYRLYLPLVPLFIWAWDRTEAIHGKKTGRIRP